MPKFQKFSSIVTSLIISTTFLTQLSANPTCRVFGLGGTQPKMVCMIREFLLEYLKQPTKASTIPHAFIFEGHTGTGKTVITETLAKETGIEIKVLHLASIVNGQKGAQAAAEDIRKIYHEAEQYAAKEQKPVLVVIEELDYIIASNQEKMDPVAKAVCGELNNQIRTYERNPRIISILITNEPENLDNKLTLCCHRVVWSFPDEADRTAIMYHYLKEYHHGLSDAYIHSVIKRSYKFVGRDFEAVFKNALSFAKYNHNSFYIQEKDFEEAFKNKREHVDLLYKEKWFWQRILGQ